MRSKVIVKCQQCGKDFYPLYRKRSEPPQRYCSNKCEKLARFGERVINFCPICGKPAISTGKRSQVYCSRKCAEKGKIGRPNNGRSNLETRQCSWCGEDVTRPASSFHGDKTFCNYKCEAEWLSEFQNGIDHPRWKGGSPERYGFTWYRARKDVLIRASFICQRCHRHKATLVHHLLPIRFFIDITQAHFASNLIALCGRCHSREHKRLASALPLLDLLNFKR